MDAAKARGWIQFREDIVSIPVAYDRQNVPQQVSAQFCIVFKSVDGVTLKGDEKSGKLQLRVCLYDTSFKQFFGRPWVGPIVSARSGGNGRLKLPYNQACFFHTSVNAQCLAVVVELVQHIESSKQQGAKAVVTCGWALLRLTTTAGDAAQSTGQNEARTASTTFYNGTPRALFHMEEPLEANELLQPIAGCTGAYQLMTHQALQKISHLLPENFIVGSNESIPGTVETKKESALVKKLRPARQLKAFVDKVAVNFYPDVARFEEEFVKHLNEDRVNREDCMADGSSVAIVERRLVVGVHNGLCYVEKPEVVLLVPHDVSMRRGTAALKKPSHQRANSNGSMQQLQQQSPARTASAERSLVLRDRVPLNGITDDPTFAVVFVVEYLVSEPVSAEDRKASRTLAKTRTYPVCVRWTAWSPFEGTPPASSEEVQVSLIGGPTPVPDSVLVYRTPDIGMESSSTSREVPGWINFVFVDAERGFVDRGGLAADGTAIPGLGYPLSAPSVLPHGGAYGETGSPFEAATARPPMPPRTTRSLPARDGIVVRDVGPVTSQPVLPSQRLQPAMPQADRTAAAASAAVSASQLPPQPDAYQQWPQAPYARQPLGPASTGGYPLEIIHYRQTAPTPDAGVASGVVDDGDMHELPFTPVHAPVVTASQLGRSATGMSRAAYARLYSAGFPPILDRHKDAPEVVDPGEAVSFSMQKEEADMLQCNEIVFQFLAFARSGVYQGAYATPATVYFTFQFYRFPQVKTDRLLLGAPERDLTADRASQPCVLYKLNPDGSAKAGPPGYQLKYHVDPAFLKPGEGKLFVQHLYNQTLHIDVWDGDTLLLVGSCAVELKHLCRQGREAIQCTYELDVVSTDLSDETCLLTGDVTRGGSVRPVGVKPAVRGKLHLRLANVGFPADPDKSARSSSTSGLARLMASGDADARGSFFGGSLNAGDGMRSGIAKRVARAEHLSRVNQELALMLRHTHVGLPTGDTTAADASPSGRGGSARDRKLARMDAVRAALDASADERQPQRQRRLDVYLSHKQQKEERARDLRLMEMYRSQMKRDGITNMLNMAITTEHVLHPTMGSADFFEFQLRNPHNVPHTVTIVIDDPDLSVVTDAREWRYLKQLGGLQTPVEEGMFSTQPTQHPEIFLRPKETVNIPFRFLTMRASHEVPPTAVVDDGGGKGYGRGDASAAVAAADGALSTRVARASFKAKDGEHLLAMLSVRAEPQPHVVDQTFRFYHPEQSFLKKSIRLPPFHRVHGSAPSLAAASSTGQVFVRCSDPNVICESRQLSPGEPQDVFIKVALGLSPQVRTFFVCVYADAFMARPVQIWQIYVHALQRIDVTCTEGQTSRLSVILRGTQSSRLVRCCSSHPLEMALHPVEPFVLAAGAVHEVHLSVRPLAAGSRFFYINVVDVECHQLVRCWLVCVTTRPPLISKAFELTLPAGGGRSSNKRISYMNPYGEPRVFQLVCNRADLVQFKESRLEMAPYETKVIGLRFVPVPNPGAAEILIFINDPDDKNEETFSIKAVYRPVDDEDGDAAAVNRPE